jgi:hypothetical protein
MPGPVSDSYDPEWGTSSNAQDIVDAISKMYSRASGVLGGRPPVNIRELAYQEHELTHPITTTLSEWEWRIIWFALERAGDSI